MVGDTWSGGAVTGLVDALFGAFQSNGLRNPQGLDDEEGGVARPAAQIDNPIWPLHHHPLQESTGRVGVYPRKQRKPAGQPPGGSSRTGIGSSVSSPLRNPLISPEWSAWVNVSGNVFKLKTAI